MVALINLRAELRRQAIVIRCTLTITKQEGATAFVRESSWLSLGMHFHARPTAILVYAGKRLRLITGNVGVRQHFRDERRRLQL